LVFYYQIFKRELGRFRFRKTAWFILLGVPLVFFSYFAAIYWEGSVQHLNVSVLDNDKSVLSRKFSTMLNSMPTISVSDELNSEDILETYFADNQDVSAVFLIPNGFEKGIYHSKQQDIVVYTNSTSIIIGNLVYKKAAELINTFSAGINLNDYLLNGIPRKKAMNMIMPVKVYSKPLFNPNYNYMYYLVPGVITVLLQMMVFLLATRALNSEWNLGTIDELISLANGSVLKIILGKSLVYTLFGMLVALFIYYILYPIMGMSLPSNMSVYLAFLLLFIWTNVILGLAFSVIFIDEAIAMDFAFVYNSPAFVFSGFTFPALGMPAFDQLYAQIIPYTYFLKGYFKYFQMESPFSYIIPEIVILLCFSLGAYIVLATTLLLRIKKRSLL